MDMTRLKNNNKVLLAVGIVVLIIGYALNYVFMGDALAHRIIKTVMKLIEAGLFFSYLIASKDKFRVCSPTLIFLGFILYTIGDLTVTFNAIGGIVFFALGHIPFIILFMQIKRPTRFDLVIWGALVAAVAAGVLITGVKFIPLGLGGIIYTIFVAGLFVSTFEVNRILTIGTGVFVLSDILIALKGVVLKDDYIMPVLISVTYYFAIIVMAEYFNSLYQRE